jgi:hypothetical protein
VSFGAMRRKKKRSGEGMGFGLIFIGGHCADEERERECSPGVQLGSAGGTVVPFGCVAVARDRRPDMAGRGTASGGSAGGGRSGGATRGAG